MNGQMTKRRERPLSSTALIRAYQEDVDRKRLLIRPAVMISAGRVGAVILGSAWRAKDRRAAWPHTIAHSKHGIGNITFAGYVTRSPERER